MAAFRVGGPLIFLPAFSYSEAGPRKQSASLATPLMPSMFQLRCKTFRGAVGFARNRRGQKDEIR